MGAADGLSPLTPPRRGRDWSAIYARRNARARAAGWASYGQQRRWTEPERLIRMAGDLNEDECGYREPPDRPGSMLCAEVNELVNPRGGSRLGTWQVRLYHAWRERHPIRAVATAAVAVVTDDTEAL